MAKSALFASLSLCTINLFGTAFAAPYPNSTSGSLSTSPIDMNIEKSSSMSPDVNVPEGYQVGLATQDWEPAGQQSICTTNCQLANPFSSTAGPSSLPPGVFAAAINPALGGAPDNCGPCGSCYSIIQSGTAYCPADSSNPSCGAPSGPAVQGGVQSIKVLITNHCPNCDDVPGHFDINQAPAGWDNPKIYWKQLDPSECL